MCADFGLPVELANQIDDILTALYRRTEAECILLADTSGQLISSRGQVQESDPILLAALAASNMAAVTELARQIGERTSHGSFLHEGEVWNVYLFNVAGSFILIVVFRTKTPVGLVRLFAGRAGEQLHALKDRFEELMSQREESFTSDFGVALSDELEKAFDGM